MGAELPHAYEQTYRRTDSRDEANRRFSKFCERA